MEERLRIMDTIKRETTARTTDSASYPDEPVALIKPAEVDGQKGYAIFAGDGTPLGWYDRFDVACAAARQHNLIPVTVH